jgi:hypothetical protein
MKNLYHKSYYSHYANQEFDWLTMDTEKLFLENLKNRKQELEQHGWIDRKFTYKFNSDGFRADEFTDQEGIVFFGCSHTVGIGLPYETTWPYLVSKFLKLRCYNLAIGGSSNDTAFRLAHHYLDKIKTKLVVMLTTYNHRLELLNQKNEILQFFGPGTSPIRNCKFYDTWLSNDTNMEANKIKNTLAINMICNNLGIKFVAMDQSEMQNLDLARDLAHRGIESNRDFSKKALVSIFSKK